MFLRKILSLAAMLLMGTLSVFAEDALQTRILYVKHGEVPGNDPNPAVYTYTGCGTDDSLTETGAIQAEECAKMTSRLQKRDVFGNISAIYSSDLKRAAETANPIAKELKLDLQMRHTNPLRK